MNASFSSEEYLSLKHQLDASGLSDLNCLQTIPIKLCFASFLGSLTLSAWEEIQWKSREYIIRTLCAHFLL